MAYKETSPYTSVKFSKFFKTIWDKLTPEERYKAQKDNDPYYELKKES